MLEIYTLDFCRFSDNFILGDDSILHTFSLLFLPSSGFAARGGVLCIVADCENNLVILYSRVFKQSQNREDGDALHYRNDRYRMVSLFVANPLFNLLMLAFFFLRFSSANYLAMCRECLMSMIVHCITSFMILCLIQNTMTLSTTPTATLKYFRHL